VSTARVARHFERLAAERRGHRTSCSTNERQRSRLQAETETFREEPGVRDIETIDAELRLLPPGVARSSGARRADPQYRIDPSVAG
jgi:hypothetical protein